MRDFIEFGSQKIEFDLQFTERKTLGITVTPEMEVIVKAPIDTPLKKVKEKVKKKAPWILKQKNFFLAYEPKMPPKKFVNGESHLYLGRNYRLKIIISNELHGTVKLKRGFFEVYTSEKEKTKSILDKWYTAKAKEKIKPLAEELFTDFVDKHKLKEFSFQFSLRKMSTRWGSCTSKGRIILNPELIKAPKACIEYVIIHELCHLIHPDHSQNFFDLQLKEMPDWEKWKNKLETLLA